MACYGPLVGFYSAHVNPSGKRSITFDVKKAWTPTPVKVPCGQCVGCRLERSRQWAMRILHEKKLHRDNCFVTLTYDDKSLPEGGTLVKRDLQLFMKRLRKVRGVGVRFYACGEYGDVSSRPHYHAILFNCDFFDRKAWSGRDGKHPLWVSRELNALWQHGMCVVGEVSFDSAAYVARYVLKKVTGDRASEHYSVRDQNGVVHLRVPEFTVMSRRPGIGAGWYDRFGRETFDHDSVIINGRPVPPPRFYDKRLELTNPELLRLIKKRRRLRQRLLRDDNTSRRRRVKEVIALTLLSRKVRKV